MFGMKTGDLASARESDARRVEAKGLPPFSVGAATEASPWHPDVNQDAFAVDAKRHLMMVADGVSGSAKGEKASGAARDAVQELGGALDQMIEDARKETGVPYLTLDQASTVMDAHFRLIADRVKKATDVGEGKVRSATTLMTAKIFEIAPGETYAIVKSVGDCQPMVLRADGQLERVDIVEDSRFAERIRSGELTEDEAHMIAESGSPEELLQMFSEYKAVSERMPTDEALGASSASALADTERMLLLFNRYYASARQERSVITAFVGGKLGAEIDVHSASVKLNPGDQLFLSTDGIDALKRVQVQEALSRGATLDQKVRMLVSEAKKANEKGDLRAKPDDITVVGMEVPRAVAARPAQRMARIDDPSRAQADAQGMEAARNKARLLAAKLENT